eukprot:TRINITY_DN3458_c0_g1_i1.p1 TRINITY_DN3458_c0_g1~~TRINITY_DN3458_c0_g1_i1.p1  ORF type:complete len:202 (+),score=46.63 TRINITY_DN3458_c0_g1_i1:38-607(+)
MSFKVRAEEMRKARVLEESRKEQASMRAKPEMSKGSKKILMQSSSHLPLYTNERLHQITAKKKRSMDKLKMNRTCRIERNAKLLQTEVKKKDLCFNPKHVKSQLFGKTDVICVETTEEKELDRTCTFRPKTNKNSDMIWSQQNRNGKSVVDRLIDYGKLHKKLREEQIRDSLPKFRPNIGKHSKVSPCK